VVLFDTEELLGIASIETSASLVMHAKALSVNRSYALTTANYEPVLMAGALRGGNTTKSLATVTWNEMPPR
jgi:hypothetical protein